MSTLPQGWESDYDGSRWFFVYRPTGQIQYHFPKPGDEFPDFIDSFSPAPTLLPEERLESQQQVKRRSTAGSSSRARAAVQRQREASALPLVDDEGGFEYSFESFGYLGPQSYNDVSPLNDDEEEEDRGPGRADKLKEGFGKDSPANISTPGERPRVSPLTSAGTTPQVAITEPSSGTPIMAEPVMGESSTVHTIVEEPIMSEPIMSAPVLSVDTANMPSQGPTHGPNQSPTVHMLDGTEITPPPPPAFTPVGIMPELYSESTAQSYVETNPPPVELPDNAIWVEPIQTVGYINEQPIELPTQHSPVEKRLEDPSAGSMSSQLQASTRQTQYPHGISATFASVTPPAESSQKPEAAQSIAGTYQPWKAGQQISDESAKRSSVILGNMSIAESQRNELGALDKRRSPGSPTTESKIDPCNVPAVLAPPRIPPKLPIGNDEQSHKLGQNVPASGQIHPLLPGIGARHASTSTPPSQASGIPSLSHYPSVLKPGPRPGPGGASLSNQPFKPQQKPYMAYRPVAPMPGTSTAHQAQVIQPQEYQALPASDSHPTPLRPGSGQNIALGQRPGVPRTNTVPDQLPSQVPAPIVTPPPVMETNTQDLGRGGLSERRNLGPQRMSTGNIFTSPGQELSVQSQHTSKPPMNSQGGQAFIMSDGVISAPEQYQARNESTPSRNIDAAASPPLNNPGTQRLGSPAPIPAREHAGGYTSANVNRADQTLQATMSSENIVPSKTTQHFSQGSFTMDESSVRAPSSESTEPHGDRMVKVIEVKPQQAPIANNLTEISSTGARTNTMPEKGLVATGHGPEGSTQKPQTLANPGSTSTPSMGVFSERTILAHRPPVPENPAGETAQPSQTLTQPAQQAASSGLRAASPPKTRDPLQQTGSSAYPQILRQPVAEEQVGQGVPKRTAPPGLQPESVQGEQTSSSPEVQRVSGNHARQPSQETQQSQRQGVMIGERTSQILPLPTNATSDPGLQSSGNLPGMTVLQAQSPSPGPARRNSQQPPASNYHQPQAPKLSSRPSDQPVQTPESRANQNFASPEANAPHSLAPGSGLPAQMQQRVQEQGQSSASQAQVSTRQSAPGQILSSKQTPVTTTQQQRRDSQQFIPSALPVSASGWQQQQGPLQQQSMPTHGQGVQSTAGQSYAQATVGMAQLQIRPGQPGQPPAAMPPYQQSPVQQSQSLPIGSSASVLQSSQSPNPAVAWNGPLPLHTAPTLSNRPSSSLPTTASNVGIQNVASQVSTNFNGGAQSQASPAQNYGMQPAGVSDSQRPSSMIQKASQIQNPTLHQSLPSTSSRGSVAPSLSGQFAQTQGMQRPQGQSHSGAFDQRPPGQAVDQMQPQLQTPNGPQTNASLGPVQIPPLGLNQVDSQNVPTADARNSISSGNMQNMQQSTAPGTPLASGQIPYNPRMFPPMPTPIITQPLNGQQPGWGQPGTPTQSGPQSPSAQRRSSQQSIPPATPSSRRASGYQIQPGTQSPVIPQQYQFPQSQGALSPNSGPTSKEKNWFSKMWKNPGNKKASVSGPPGGSLPPMTMGGTAAPGLGPGPAIYEQQRHGPNKLQKSQAPPGAQNLPQHQGYPMAYNMPHQMQSQIQGAPGSHFQAFPQNMVQQPMSGQPSNFQAAPNQMTRPKTSQLGNGPPSGVTTGAVGQSQPANQGGFVPNWQQQHQSNTPPGAYQGMPISQPGQHAYLGQSSQLPIRQDPTTVMPLSQQTYSNQLPPAHQYWQYSQNAGTGAAAMPNTSTHQSHNAQSHAQPQAPQIVSQSAMAPPQQGQQRQSGDFVAAATTVAGAVGTVGGLNAAGPPIDNSCVVAPLFSGTGQSASIPAPADSSFGSDSAYPVVGSNDSVNIDIEPLSVDANGNAWTTTSIDYEGNDWGETW